MSTNDSPDRVVHPDEPAAGADTGDDTTDARKGPARADAEDPSMGGSSDGDTSA